MTIETEAYILGALVALMLLARLADWYQHYTERRLERLDMPKLKAYIRDRERWDRWGD